MGREHIQVTADTSRHPDSQCWSPPMPVLSFPYRTVSKSSDHEESPWSPGAKIRPSDAKTAFHCQSNIPTLGTGNILQPLDLFSKREEKDKDRLLNLQVQWTGPCDHFRRATTGIKQCRREQKQVHGPGWILVWPFGGEGQDDVLSLLRE